MGSLEEEKLLQMVHDFIESEPTSSLQSNYPHQNHLQFHHSSRYFTLQEILKDKTKEEMIIEEKVVGKYMKKKLSREKTTGLKQWLVKCLVFDGFHASLVHTSWLTASSCPCGSYEYIEIVEEDAKGGLMTIIVDIDFKSQFEIARPTQAYKDLLNKLPTIFVGQEAKLNSIITLLCSAAEESLREQGLHIPPWRRPTYMRSKWKLTNIITNDSNQGHDYKGFSCNNHNYISDKPKNGRRRQVGFGGSGLSNQFSKMSINCC